ncbi:hypothetical protein [Proteus appendicitidis]|uniref:Uncharacterized protein n=1 Tax=Proteus appendicitidis TaxID=3034648 RepID=A0ABY8Y9A8_9GAMM|nr:hypothetical protein [Proteus sp. HZ0627]WIV88999.1 hypothetical protein QQS39_03025 [Proteus sp. HZ0627]
MELKHKLSDHCESLLQTETSKMTQYQAGALDFVEKIDNLRLVIRHAFSNGRTMLAIPFVIGLLWAFSYGIKTIYIDPWKNTESIFLRILEKKDNKNNIVILPQHRDNDELEKKYIQNGRLSFLNYWDYYYYSNSFIREKSILLDLFLLLTPLLCSLPMIYFGFIARNRPYLICDREKQLFYTWDMKMNVYVAKYSQINFSDIKPTLALILYRVDENQKLIEHKYYPNLTMFSFLGGGSSNDKAWGLGYITKYLFYGLAPLIEGKYTRKKYSIFREAPIPKDLDKQIEQQVLLVDNALPPCKEIENKLSEAIKRSI